MPNLLVLRHRHGKGRRATPSLLLALLLLLAPMYLLLPQLLQITLLQLLVLLRTTAWGSTNPTPGS